jgi:hypothetical protein
MVFLLLPMLVSLAASEACASSYRDSGFRWSRNPKPSCSIRSPSGLCLHSDTRPPRAVRLLGGAAGRWLYTRVMSSRLPQSLPSNDPDTKCCARHDGVVACDIYPTWLSNVYTSHPDRRRQVTFAFVDKTKDWKDLQVQFVQDGRALEKIRTRWANGETTGYQGSATIGSCTYNFTPQEYWLQKQDGRVLRYSVMVSGDDGSGATWEDRAACPFNGNYYYDSLPTIEEPRSMTGLEI